LPAALNFSGAVQAAPLCFAANQLSTVPRLSATPHHESGVAFPTRKSKKGPDCEGVTATPWPLFLLGAVKICCVSKERRDKDRGSRLFTNELVMSQQ
jgi:hypothetical protein